MIVMLLLYCLLLSIIIKPYMAVNDDLKEISAKAAGIYVNPEQHRSSYQASIYDRLKTTILVSAYNIAYYNHMTNFKCFADRLDLKFFLAALEPRAYNASLSLGSNVYPYYHNATIVHGTNPNDLQDAYYFREHNFNLISVLKLEVVLAIMTLGYDVIFIDSDVALIRDPVPYMLLDNIDYIYTVNAFCPACYLWDFYSDKCDGNTGVYSIRSNSKTIKFWKRVLYETTRQPEFDDQTVFWQTIRLNSDLNIPLANCSNILPNMITASSIDDTIISCPLDGCRFSMGGARQDKYEHLSKALQSKNESLILIHANFINGNGAKYAALLARGFWISNYPLPGCMPYTGSL